MTRQTMDDEDQLEPQGHAVRGQVCPERQLWQKACIEDLANFQERRDDGPGDHHVTKYGKLYPWIPEQR